MGNCWKGFCSCLNCFNKPRAPTVERVEEPPLPLSATMVEEVVDPSVPVSEPTVEVVDEAPVAGSAPTLGEVVDSLQAVSDTADLNEFVVIIKQLLEEKRGKGSTSQTAKEKRGMWTSFVTSGAKFLEFVNRHTEKLEDAQDIFCFGNSRVVAEIVGQIGQLHWAVGGLSIVAYLIENFDKVSANKTEALELISNMIDLATNVIKLRESLEEGKLKRVVMLLVQGSIMCVSQIYSEKFFSFLKTSVNCENLKEMSKTLDHLYRDLTLTILVASAKRQSTVLPMPKPFYPKDPVGIENAQDEVIKLLNMTTEDESTLVVVVYGFGGIGKTTLARAVVASLDLDRYNYVRVDLYEDKNKNNFTKMQQIILNDGFPAFHSHCRIELRDPQEGRDRLKNAFMCIENKPVFFYIDNALRSEDLKELLPDDLSDMPKQSRILLTTRMLNQTDVFLPLNRRSFAVKTLEKDHAVEILCKDLENRERINDDIERILRICGGVPLALKIVGAHLMKTGYTAGKCTQILDALEKGTYVKEEKLSQRIVHFVYNELEDGTKDAFLDMCCFFRGWSRRLVEYILGVEEVQSLEEAALLTPLLNDCMWTLSAGEERMHVHDIVMATGRSMSTSTTRFIDSESFSQASQDETKLNGIKGFRPFQEDGEYVVDVKQLNSMRHSLRILGLEAKMKTSAQSQMKFKELRYLEVLNNEVSHLPMKVEELDMLRVYEGPIAPNKLPKSLHLMAITLPFQNEIFAASSIQNHSLKELWLHGENIEQFPDGLHQLCSLKYLGLINYNKMEEFPEQICKLSSLIKLEINDWELLKCLPQSIGQLKGLTHLQIRECSELEGLPSSFGELTALEHLILVNCPKLNQLPGGLQNLKCLCVRNCENLSLESYQNKPDLRIVL